MLAITLLLAFAFPLAVPLIAATADSADSLPSCCRMHGAHKCSMTRASGTGTLPAFRSSSCPLYPTPPRLIRNIPATLGISLPLSVHPTYSTAQVTFWQGPYSLSMPGANLKRGPPTFLA
jgi:hypothetical protein